MTNPDFIELAKAMRVHAIRVHSAEELPAKMKEFLEYPNDKPVLMECMVSTNEHVFPMVSLLFSSCLPMCCVLNGFVLQVPAGKALHEQMLHPKLRSSYDAANKKS